MVRFSQIGATLAQLEGERSWGAKVGWGSFITIEIGAPRTTPDGRTRGEFHLWVYGSNWDIVKSGKVLADSESARDKMEASVARLNGQIVSVTCPMGSFSMELVFDGDVRLRVRPYDDPGDMEAWLLFLPDGDVLAAGPGETWSIRPSSGPRE